MRLVTAFLVVLIALPPPAPAQVTPDTLNYLPLGLGNAWAFYTVRERPPGQPNDTLFGEAHVIEEALMLGGKTYYRLTLPLFGADTLHYDGAGRVFRWDQGDEMLWFDFTLPDSATYKIPFEHDDSYHYVVTVRRNETLTTAGGRFTDVLTFSFDVPEIVDEEFHYAFARGVGPIRLIASMGIHEWLYHAEIDGQVVTSLEEERPRQAFLMQAYPNPFQAATTIRFVPVQPGPVLLEIYDMLGRRRATVLDGLTTSGGLPQQVSWRADGLPAGVYFARLRQGTVSQTIKLVVIR